MTQAAFKFQVSFVRWIVNASIVFNCSFNGYRRKNSDNVYTVTCIDVRQKGLRERAASLSFTHLHSTGELWAGFATKSFRLILRTPLAKFLNYTLRRELPLPQSIGYAHCLHTSYANTRIRIYSVLNNVFIPFSFQCWCGCEWRWRTWWFDSSPSAAISSCASAWRRRLIGLDFFSVFLLVEFLLLMYISVWCLEGVCVNVKSTLCRSISKIWFEFVLFRLDITFFLYVYSSCQFVTCDVSELIFSMNRWLTRQDRPVRPRLYRVRE